jgi:hypothetical protein
LVKKAGVVAAPALLAVSKEALLGSIKFSLQSVNKDLQRWKKIKSEAEQDSKAAAERMQIQRVQTEQEAARVAAADSQTTIATSSALSVSGAAAAAIAARTQGSSQGSPVPTEASMAVANRCV